MRRLTLDQQPGWNELRSRTGAMTLIDFTTDRLEGLALGAALN
jgi:hypothetical protein